MDIIKACFSLSGRLGRSDFWLYWIILGVISRVIGLLGSMVASQAGDEAGPGRLLVSGITLFWLWPTTALLVKRGHDRGYPAARTIAVMMLSLVGTFGAAAGYSLPGVILFAAVAIYLLIDYGLLEGQRGPNAYGERARVGDGKPLVLS